MKRQCLPNRNRVGRVVSLEDPVGQVHGVVREIVLPAGQGGHRAIGLLVNALVPAPVLADSVRRQSLSRLTKSD